MKYWILLPLCFTLASCKQGGTANNTDTHFKLFNPVKADFSTETVNVPKGMTVDVLFSETIDSVVTATGKYPSLGYADYVAYVPINNSSEHGYLYVNHETNVHNDNLGDGGGGSWIEVQKENGSWKVTADARAIDFSPIGGTLRNCGGAVTPNGTILTAEVSPLKRLRLADFEV